MHYAKIHNNEVLVYPYDFLQLQADNPFTNFNTSDSVFNLFQSTEECVLRGRTLVEVTVQEKPSYNVISQNVTQETTPTLNNGNWVLGWSIVDMTEDEKNAYKANQAAIVRQTRNNLLQSSDSTQTSDFGVGNNNTTAHIWTADEKAAWVVYRKQLRDLPLQPGFPFNVTWPTGPQPSANPSI